MMAGGVIMSTWGGFLSTEKNFGSWTFCVLALLQSEWAFQKFYFLPWLMVCYGVALTMVQTAITTMLQEKRTPLCRGVYLDYGTMYAGFLPIGMAMFGRWLIFFPHGGL